MHKIHHIHFVGIGGTGMSGIAEVLHNLKYAVTGSDLHRSATTQELASQGIRVYIGHKDSHIGDADVVVYSGAVPADNTELMLARQRSIPVVPRAQMLSELMRLRKSIAVAGSHGKTTTTSVIAEILNAAKFDPTYVVGGRLANMSGLSRLGLGEYMVAEADESDSSFLYIDSTIKVVTNIDNDHLANYHDRMTELRRAFVEFIQHLPFYGIAVLGVDSPIVRQILPEINRKTLTFGFDASASVRAENLELGSEYSHFDVVSDLCPARRRYRLRALGRHNVLNALAAIAVAIELDVDEEAIASALENFPGVVRRLEVSRVRWNSRTVTLVDDYAHHPYAIGEVIKTVRECLDCRRLIVCFQPHRYSRLYSLFGDFSQVFSLLLGAGDELLISEVYSAGEEMIDDCDSRSLCHSIRQRSKLQPVYCSSSDVMLKTVSDMAEDGDLVLLMGAGDIGQLAGKINAMATSVAGRPS